jgi:hypothetical protein
MDVKGLGYNNMNYIHLSQDGDWWAAVNMVMNL